MLLLYKYLCFMYFFVQSVKYTIYFYQKVLNWNTEVCLKPLDTLWTEQTLQGHRFTNNLHGLHKVMMKDFPWNIIPWNGLLF